MEEARSLNDIAMGQMFELEELLDKPALLEMVQSFETLFGVPLRIFSQSGALLADTQNTLELYRYLESGKAGRNAVQATIAEVRRVRVETETSVSVPCVSGGQYLVTGIVYEGRVLGRTLFGPFVTPGDAPSESLLAVDPALDRAEITRLYGNMPRLSTAACLGVDRHLRKTLDLLVFSGLKAHLASSMHMASVRESFRELTDKNKKLQAAYDRLKELDRLKSNFLATVSHELRTPLTSIIGYSEMMIEGIAGDVTAEQREFLSTIHEKGEQLLGLIKSLLDLSKLESGTMSMRRADVDPITLLGDIVTTFAPSARRKGIQLTAEVPPDLPMLHADVERLRQVLNNLTENAIKFTPSAGSITLSASLVALRGPELGGVGGVLMGKASRKAIEFRVADTGIGIPPEERDRVFDAFYQVDSSSTRESGGTGLGLSIVKRLVDSHDGTVTILGNEPQGTVFVVTLPLAPKNA